MNAPGEPIGGYELCLANNLWIGDPGSRYHLPGNNPALDSPNGWAPTLVATTANSAATAANMETTRRKKWTDGE
ncbi:hypothetical protein FRC08_017535 [Ceratobasidium sp. 394]|nr:hypothetical protein FRC08_017535 [Ceratobasidium sp. 394]